MVVLSGSRLCIADYNVGVAAAVDRGAELGYSASIHLPLARNDGVISLDNIHNDVTVIVCRGIRVLVGFPNECFCNEVSVVT